MTALSVRQPSRRDRAGLRLADERGGLPPTGGPDSVGIVLTNACNLRCITCWSYSPLRSVPPTPSWTRQHNDRELLSDLFRDLAALGTSRVIFTGGGDPLVHPEFAAIVADAKSFGLKVTLISNLTLVRNAEGFCRLGIDTILANMSCADPASYVAFHPGRRADDFDRLIVLLRSLRAVRTQVKLVFVVCRVNADVISSALRIAADLNAEMQFKLMSATSDTASLLLTEHQHAALLEEEDQLHSLANELHVTTNLSVLYSALKGERIDQFPIEQVGCHAGYWYARVTAAGDVFYCCNLRPELRIGSLHKESFSTLWASAQYGQARERMRSGDLLPGCDRCGKFDLNTRVAIQLAESGL